MSEQQTEQLYGHAEREASQGYTPMPEIPSVQERADAAETETTNRFAEHVEELNRTTTDGVGEPIPIQYNKADGSGASPENQSVTAERAARDLTNYRRGLGEIETALKDQALSEELEKLRSPLMKEIAEAKGDGEAAAEHLASYNQAQREALEPQPQQPQSAEPDPVAKALEDPRVLNAVLQQRQLDLAEGQRAAAAAHEAIQQSAAMARAAILVRHPELQNLTAEQWPVAMQMLAQKDPAKFAQVKQEIEGAQHLLQTAAQMQAQQQQVQQQQQTAQFQAWGQHEDAAWEADFAKEHPQRQAAIKQEALSMLREHGLSDQEIAWSWNSNPLFRSRAGQKVLADAAAYRLQQRTAQTIRPTHAVPKVQRPGSSAERVSQDDSDLRSLSNRLQQTGSARDAAALLAARRVRFR